MKKAIGIWVLIGGLLGWNFLSAQEITAQLDLGRKDAKPDHIEYISADDGLVTFGPMSRKTSRFLGLTKYDPNFDKVWTKQILQQNGRANVDEIAVLGDNIFVFISEFKPKEKIIETSFTQVDLEGNMLANREIISTDPNAPEHRVALKYVRSINKRKLLCYKNLDNNDDRERLQYYLFDHNSPEIISGTIEVPYPDDKFQVREISVSNGGEVYILGKFFRVNRVKEPDDYGFKLYRLQAGSDRMMELDLPSNNNYVTDLLLKVDRNENAFLTGFYSERSTSEIIGTVFFRINDQFNIEVQAANRFSDQFLNQFLNSRQIDRGRELRNFYLDNMVLRSDGGVLMLAEKYYTTFNSYMDAFGYWTEQRIHHYDDIIVNSVGANGEIEWSSVVPKQQMSEMRDNLGYVDVVSGAELFLIYGYRPRRAPAAMYLNVVGPEGQVSNRELLRSASNNTDDLFPRLSQQISNSEALMVFYQDRDKILSIARVQF